jgi:predicted short-subunit dehydrogenase-like oxidoreductase (DUF2520 family)
MQNSLAIIGAGRVGCALGRRLRERGWSVGAVVTRGEPSARKSVRFIGAGRAHAAISTDVLTSRVILIAVPDDEISSVAAALAFLGGQDLRRKVVLHTSGVHGSEVLDALKSLGAAAGSMHPLQSFSGVSVPPLEGRLFAIEGDARAVRVARQMARSLGGSPVRLAGAKKPLYHTAAALAAGHLLAVEEAAVQLLVSLGMKRREALRALLPLTRQILENYESLGPRAAWTGPLARGDFKVLRAHLEALRDSPPEFARVYESLSRLAARVLSQYPDRLLADFEKTVLEVKCKARAATAGGKA